MENSFFKRKIFYRKSSGDHILKKQREVFLWKEAKNRHIQRSKQQVRCKSTCLRIVRTSSQKDSQTAVTVVKPLGPSRASVYQNCNSHPVNADDQIPLHCDLGKKMIISFTKCCSVKAIPLAKCPFKYQATKLLKLETRKSTALDTCELISTAPVCALLVQVQDRKIIATMFCIRWVKLAFIERKRCI